MNIEEKLYSKLGKVLLDKFLDDLGKEMGNRKIKENVYSFLNGVKIGIELAEGYSEEDLFLFLGTIFGYAFSRMKKSGYFKEAEES